MKNSIAVSSVRGVVILTGLAVLLSGCIQTDTPDNGHIISKKYPGETKDVGEGATVTHKQPPITKIWIFIDGTGALIKDEVRLEEAELLSYAEGLSRNTGWHSISLLTKHDGQSIYAKRLEETIEAISEDIDVSFSIFRDIK